ncbi:hypothetical protein BB561_005877 [Smittium simulii]|uniref:Amino-acid acetyltransferase, mitochondrial n=1 Tax=Smittium simulii TaxID=133385 RepID=A0A2T9Y7W5_9FUNG|nr:hypothetical protein BB561_005877 [Smittium simulii]
MHSSFLKNQKELVNVVMSTKLCKKEAKKLLAKLQANESGVKKNITPPFTNQKNIDINQNYPSHNAALVGSDNTSPALQNISSFSDKSLDLMTGYKKSEPPQNKLFFSKSSPVFFYISAQSLSENLKSIAKTISFTQRLGFPTLVVIALGPENRTASEIETSNTDKSPKLNYVVEYNSNIYKLAEEIEKMGSKSFPLTQGIFKTLSNSITSHKDISANTSKIISLIQRNKIPIISTTAINSNLQYLTFDPNIAFLSIIKSLSLKSVSKINSNQSSNDTNSNYLDSKNSLHLHELGDKIDLNESRIIYLKSNGSLIYPTAKHISQNYKKGISKNNSPSYPITFINLIDEYNLLFKIYKNQGDGFMSEYIKNTSIGVKSQIKETCNSEKDSHILNFANTCLQILPSTSIFLTASANSPSHNIIKKLLNEKPSSIYLQPFQFAKAYNSQKFHNVQVVNEKHFKILKNVNYQSNQDIAATEKDYALSYTLIRRGFSVNVYNKLEDVNIDKLFSLLESSFKKSLLKSEYYLRLKMAQNNSGICIIVVGDYLGAAVVTLESGIDSIIDKNKPSINNNLVTNEPQSLLLNNNDKKDLSKGALLSRYLKYPYLDKFAVEPSAQGTGLADILWNRLVIEFPICSWRSRSNNFVNKWYFTRSHGHLNLLPDSTGTSYITESYQNSLSDSINSIDQTQKGYHWVCFWYIYSAITPSSFSQLMFKKDIVDNFAYISYNIPPSFK